MKNLKKGVLLVNLGTPDSTSTGDVRKYLREFLMDGRVIDIDWWKRFLLVNMIIAPFRAPKSAKEYKKVWTDEGSPLLVYGQRVYKMLQESLGSEYKVALGMRYQSPSLAGALQELKEEQVDQIIVIPLFPQYASATTGSIYEEVMDQVKKWQLFPAIQFIDTFATLPEMIDIFARKGQKHLDEGNYDHILFSYHGLPERQLKKADKQCLTGDCCGTYHKGNRLCYRAQCYATSRALAENMNLAEDQYTVTFQSRLGRDPWIQPYTDQTLDDLAKKGAKKILAFSPAFVADCLETVVEIGQEYNHDFQEKGGEKIQLVESLNDDPAWVEALVGLVKKHEVTRLV